MSDKNMKKDDNNEIKLVKLRPRIYCPFKRRIDTNGFRYLEIPQDKILDEDYKEEVFNQHKIFSKEWTKNRSLLKEIPPCELYNKILEENKLDLLIKVEPNESNSKMPMRRKSVRKTKEIKSDVTDSKKSDVIITNESKVIENPIDIREEEVLDGVRLDISLNTGYSGLILGKSKAGKTVLLKYIYLRYYSGSKYIASLFTGSPTNFNKKNKKYKRLIINEGFDDNYKKIIMIEKEINTRCLNNYQPKYNFVNFFDDLIDIGNNRLLNSMVLTYRNSKISTWLLMQYSNLISKMSRSNYNYIFFFSLGSNDESVEVVIKSYLSSIFREKYGITSLQEQVALYKTLTSDYRFIFLDNLKGNISVHKINLKYIK